MHMSDHGPLILFLQEKKRRRSRFGALMPCTLTHTRKQRRRSKHGPASRVCFIALSKSPAENEFQLLSMQFYQRTDVRCDARRDVIHTKDPSTHHPSQVLIHPTQRWRTTAGRAPPRESIWHTILILISWGGREAVDDGSWEDVPYFESPPLHTVHTVHISTRHMPMIHHMLHHPRTAHTLSLYLSRMW